MGPRCSWSAAHDELYGADIPVQSHSAAGPTCWPCPALLILQAPHPPGRWAGCRCAPAGPSSCGSARCRARRTPSKFSIGTAFTHVIHGFGPLFSHLAGVAARAPIAAAAGARGPDRGRMGDPREQRPHHQPLIARTPISLDYFRRQASVNSVADTVSMIFGFTLAAWLPVWSVVVLAIAIEVFAAVCDSRQPDAQTSSCWSTRLQVIKGVASPAYSALKMRFIAIALAPRQGQITPP